MSDDAAAGVSDDVGEARVFEGKRAHLTESLLQHVDGGAQRRQVRRQVGGRTVDLTAQRGQECGKRVVVEDDEHGGNDHARPCRAQAQRELAVLVGDDLDAVRIGPTGEPQRQYLPLRGLERVQAADEFLVDDGAVGHGDNLPISCVGRAPDPDVHVVEPGDAAEQSADLDDLHPVHRVRGLRGCGG